MDRPCNEMLLTPVRRGRAPASRFALLLCICIRDAAGVNRCRRRSTAAFATRAQRTDRRRRHPSFRGAHQPEPQTCRCTSGIHPRDGGYGFRAQPSGPPRNDRVWCDGADCHKDCHATATGSYLRGGAMLRGPVFLSGQVASLKRFSSRPVHSRIQCEGRYPGDHRVRGVHYNNHRSETKSGTAYPRHPRGR